MWIGSAVPGHDDAAIGNEIAVSSCRIAFQFVRRRQRNDRNDNALLRRKSCKYVAVAAIVARAAENLPSFRLGKETEGLVQHLHRCRSHERVAGDAETVDRRAINLADTFYRINIVGQVTHREALIILVDVEDHPIESNK